jgi:hypothetical protein
MLSLTGMVACTSATPKEPSAGMETVSGCECAFLLHITRGIKRVMHFHCEIVPHAPTALP